MFLFIFISRFVKNARIYELYTKQKKFFPFYAFASMIFITLQLGKRLLVV